jgi:hypothetical protein
VEWGEGYEEALGGDVALAVALEQVGETRSARLEGLRAAALVG